MLKHALAMMAATLFTVHAAASVITPYIDQEKWSAAVGVESMIDFIGWPDWTVITDQYASNGLHFSNLVQIQNSQTYSDGSGLVGWDGVRIHFAIPHHAVAVDYVGVISFALYYKGEHIDSFGTFSNQWGPFAGVISEIAFDEVYLFVPQPPFSNGLVAIDNLYWGAPIPAPGALGLFALAALAARRRRRT